MTVERYKETHSQRTPGQDGLSTARVFKDDKWQDFVLLTKAPEGERTLRISQGDNVTNYKEVADGQAALRDGQLDDVFGGRANALTGAFKSMKKGDAVKGSQQRKSQSGNSNRGSESTYDENRAAEEESQSNIGKSDSNSDAGSFVHVKGHGYAAPAFAAEHALAFAFSPWLEGRRRHVLHHAWYYCDTPRVCGPTLRTNRNSPARVRTGRCPPARRSGTPAGQSGCGWE